MSLLVCVDDIIFSGNDSNVFIDFKNYLNARFQIKDLGPLKYLLGIEAVKGPQRLLLCQH